VAAVQGIGRGIGLSIHGRLPRSTISGWAQSSFGAQSRSSGARVVM